ncbi:Berberine bridge enzyme-like 28 [Citrus sinensis]|uniref:Berberine bridge enzyme-like 28 n=1 Tax=Citrus sinensis TaxID=2711 RepID=A0ACB8JKE2_CITSI|nr:Berberine bridge enzyme-like 28 [Citrus sinensis]
MKSTTIILSITLALLLSFHGIVLLTNENFLQCLSVHSEDTSISEVIYTQDNPLYSSILDFSKQNLLFRTPKYPKPQVIIKPFHVSQIQTVLKCSQKHGLQIRVRSGEKKTAWVQAGATLGQLYYRIAEKSKILGFPAGVCPTVGVGGHFSGGGYGYVMRKFGLSADQVVDAHLIDVRGRILDRKSMGEDLFWAIRGGGAASFGIIVAWKVNLVTVPSTVTAFTVTRTLENNATKILDKYQYVADKLPEDLVISATFRAVTLSNTKKKGTIMCSFSSLFLGGVDRLLPLMQERFPELGLTKEDCKEMSWIESAIYLSGLQASEPYKLEALLDRNYSKSFFKEKSDYVREPIPVKGFEGMYDLLYEKGGHNIQVVIFPYGGKMSEISESAIPFPHRAGNIYYLLYFAVWEKEEESQNALKLATKMYNYMTPYASKNPRAAYLNDKDLEIGRNNKGDTHTSIKKASIWGYKYFMNNFNKLVDVKTMVDPDNFFRNEQSIPSRSSSY